MDSAEMDPIDETAGPAPGPQPGPETPERAWTYWDVAVVTSFAIGAQFLVYLGGLLALLLIGQLRGPGFHITDAMTRVSFILPAQLAWWAMVFWIVYRIVRARDPRPFREAIGWVRPVSPPGVYLAGGAVLALSVGGLAWLLPKASNRMPMEHLFRDPASAFLLAAFGVLIAPAVEELLFRGFLFPVIERANGTRAAVLGTAVLFSFLHAQQYGWNWQNLVVLSYVGIVFGTVRAISGSLVPSTLIHASYNLTLFAGLYAASDRFRHFNF